ncbi:MAG: tRNA pseudouridine(55) synthase TruB [Solirubrobacteraceae bacterium]
MNDTIAAGILLADKPAGISSHDVVARARHALGLRRIGHAGTLDPFATGLLIVLVGRATRLQRYFMALPKTYDVVAQLGARSTTGDPEGEVVRTGVFPPEPLQLPHGRILQRPPAYSAVKVDGERAYARARRGETVELAEREVEVFDAREISREDDRVSLRVVCSSGTYVRSIVSELGDAYCLELRRSAIGPFDVDGAWPTQGPVSLLDVGEACARFMEVVEVGEADALAISHGRSIGAAGEVGPGPVLLVGATGALAVAELRRGVAGRPMLAPSVGLHDQ